MQGSLGRTGNSICSLASAASNATTLCLLASASWALLAFILALAALNSAKDASLTGRRSEAFSRASGAITSEPAVNARQRVIAASLT